MYNLVAASPVSALRILNTPRNTLLLLLLLLYLSAVVLLLLNIVVSVCNGVVCFIQSTAFC